MSASAEALQTKKHPGGFQKGHDPRRNVGLRILPSGKTLAQLARESTEEALNVIVSVMKNRDPETGEPADFPIKERVSAANKVLDRGWGRATTTVHIETESKEIAELSREALMRLAAGVPPEHDITYEGEVISVERNNT